MQLASDFPEIHIPSVAQFVEGFAWLFDLGTKQDEKITLARTYTSMQDRYSLLAGADSAPLIEAMAGISIYTNKQQSEELQRILSVYLGHMQQLVSWFQACLVFQTHSQAEFNETLLKQFVAPQLGRLLIEIFPKLPEYSPLKQLDFCINGLIDYDYDPVKACKQLLRSLLNEKLQHLDLPHLGFNKSLNALDDRSAKSPSTQRRELKDLDDELSGCLDETTRQQLINELTGVYAAMMALKHLHKRMEQWSPLCFQQFVRQLYEDFSAFACGPISLRHQANSDLLEELYGSDKPQHILFSPVISPVMPATSAAFQQLLRLCKSFSCSDEPDSLRTFLRDGLRDDCSQQALVNIQRQLEDFSHKAYYPGVKAFILGALALCNQEIVHAEQHFTASLNASEHWPLGIFRNQAALFCLGLKFKQNPSPPPKTINPLLAVYLASLPQEYVLLLDTRETTEARNLRWLIEKYNMFCSVLSKNPADLLINPLRKIEEHLQKIFYVLEQQGLPETEEHLRQLSLEMTNKRKRQRVKSDFLGTSLYNLLQAGNMEVLLYVFHFRKLNVIPNMIPAIDHYLNLPKELQNAIIAGADPQRNS